MSANLQPFIDGVTKRLGEFAQASPFKGNPLGTLGTPFGGGFNVGSPFQNTQLTGSSPFQNQPGGVSSPFNGGFNVGSPFQGSGFNVGSPFGGGTFNGQSPFGSAFGNVSSPFGGNPFNLQDPKAMEAATRAAQQAQNGRGSGGGGGIDFSGPATADDNQGITGQQIDQFIASKFANSPLIGQGQALLDAANQNGISVLMLLGIAWKESGMGSNVGAGNIWGITDPSRDTGLGGQRAFENFGGVANEIQAAARLLGSSTYRGKSIAEQIGSWYVGPQEYAARGLDATDRAGNGTVRDYINNFIAATYSAFGKAADPNARPTQRAGGGGSGDLAALGQQLAAKAQMVLGIPYSHGGIRSTGRPQDGMDCSSFAGWLLGMDKNLWNAQVQYDSTRRVNAGEARAGDLVFFQGTTSDDPTARPVTHVGVYLGNGMMIHTGGDGGVMIVSLNSDYWQSHFYGYGRVR